MSSRAAATTRRAIVSPEENADAVVPSCALVTVRVFEEMAVTLTISDPDPSPIVA